MAKNFSLRSGFLCNTVFEIKLKNIHFKGVFCYCYPVIPVNTCKQLEIMKLHIKCIILIISIK